MIQLMEAIISPAVNAIINNKNDTLEILSKVNEFYESAWNKLLIIGSLIGIVIPLIVQFYQKQVLKLSEKEFEAKMNLKIIGIRKEIQEEINNKFVEKFKEFDSKIDKAKKASIAQSHHIQGVFHTQKDEFYNAIKDYINAAKNYSYCEDDFNLKRVLENISITLDELKKEDLENLKDIDNIDLSLTIIEIQKKLKTDALLDFIKEIKTKLHKLMA